MLALLLLIPLFAGLVAGTRHGVLAGLAAGAVAAIAELLLLSIAGVAARRRDAKQAAARQATAAADAAERETPSTPGNQADPGADPETIDAHASKPYVPPPPAARSVELRARRPEDRTRPIDLLPSPLGSRPAWLEGDDGQRLPAYLGEYASYQRLSLDLDARSTSTAAVYREKGYPFSST